MFSQVIQTTKSIIKPLLLSSVFSYGGSSASGGLPSSETNQELEESSEEVIELSQMASRNAALAQSKRVHKIISYLEKALRQSKTAWTPTANFSTFVVEMSQ